MITSIHNPKVKRIRDLLSRRQTRDQEHAYVIEGIRLVEEAFNTHSSIEYALFCQGLTDRGQKLLDGMLQHQIDILEVSPHTLSAVAGTESPQGILAVLPYLDKPFPVGLDFIVIADGIRDPGNLGTIIRTASAAGVQAFILSPGTTDPYSPKVVRSAMGAHFHLPMKELSWENIKEICFASENHLGVLTADNHLGLPPWQHDLKRPIAIVIGNEAEGPSQQAKELATDWISIPMPGYSESLNAAIAAGILLFETVRQRNQVKS